MTCPLLSPRMPRGRYIIISGVVLYAGRLLAKDKVNEAIIPHPLLTTPC